MTETTQSRRLKRLWMPAVILVLGIGGMTALVMTDDLEPVLQFWIMTGIIFGTPLLLAFWTLFFSGVRWWQRFALLIVGALAGAGLVYGATQTLDFAGSISGSGARRRQKARSDSRNTVIESDCQGGSQ